MKSNSQIFIYTAIVLVLQVLLFYFGLGGFDDFVKGVLFGEVLLTLGLIFLVRDRV